METFNPMTNPHQKGQADDFAGLLYCQYCGADIEDSKHFYNCEAYKKFMRESKADLRKLLEEKPYGRRE